MKKSALVVSSKVTLCTLSLLVLLAATGQAQITTSQDAFTNSAELTKLYPARLA